MDKKQLQELLYETHKEFCEYLEDYELYWFDSAESMIRKVDPSDWYEHALYYQWYIEWMKCILSSLQ